MNKNPQLYGESLLVIEEGAKMYYKAHGGNFEILKQKLEQISSHIYIHVHHNLVHTVIRSQIEQKHAWLDRKGARTLPRKSWEAPWMKPIERIVLVHRLREVQALAGFTREHGINSGGVGERTAGA